MPETAPPWPYPFWIAHRGAGTLAPENTLAALRRGAQHGYRMFECDVRLSADGKPFLLHDATLTRTTDAGTRLVAGASAMAGDHPWATLSRLDAGSWHAPEFAGEPLATLDDAARFCRANGHALNIEIKPAPHAERRTGQVVAAHAALLWRGAPLAPLLTSFSPDALEGARDTAPDLPRGLLLEALWTGWLETALMLGCVAVVCHHALWDVSSMTQAKSAGFRALSYTVNDAEVTRRLIALGADGLITDRADLVTPG
jgi:glycerophosphoryl diester phosphodiesterase